MDLEVSVFGGEVISAEARSAANEAASAGFESMPLRTAAQLSFELRSFVQGARNSLQQFAQIIANRALLDSKLAVQTTGS